MTTYVNKNLTKELSPKCRELKKEFEELVRENITRDGIDELMKYIEDETDFYTAPASTRFHCSEEGGLVRHSINVFNELSSNKSMAKDKYSDESIAIVSLFHDLCKVNMYEVSTRNVKDEFGRWKQVPYYTTNEQFPFGHGEQSVYLLMKHGLSITDEEAMAIRWHMGGFTDSVKGGSYSISKAFSSSILAVELHIADLRATHIDEL